MLIPIEDLTELVMEEELTLDELKLHKLDLKVMEEVNMDELKLEEDSKE